MRARHAEAQRANEEQQAEVERRAEKIAALEAAIAARDRAVGDLEKALETSRAEHAELGAAHAALAARATDLERELAARDEKIASLEGAATAAAREAARAEQQLADYEQRMHAAAHEIASLQDEIAARDQLIERLKTDLHAKQDALDLLERNVQRLNEIGASLEGLDKRFSTNSILSARLQPVPRAEAAAADRAMSPPSVERGSTAAPTPSDAHARRLIIALDGDQRRTYPLDGAVLTIGRGADSDIRIQSPFVSRTHARILLREGATLIEDLDSKNGILVNSKAIDRTVALHDGDIISLGGQLELKYVDLDRRNGSAARH
jgi:hypothetical protein